MASPTALSRFTDLHRQGFMKRYLHGQGFIKRKTVKIEKPIIACDACLNWHREGKHTASATERKANLKLKKLKKL